MRTQHLFVWIIVCLAAAVLLNSGGAYGDQLALAIQQQQQREVDQWVEKFKRQLAEDEEERWIARYPLALELPILPTSERP